MSTTITLSDGRKVTLRPSFKVRDLLSVQRLAGGDKDILGYLVIASRILIDGEPATQDDILDMEFKDFDKVSGIIPEVADFISGQEK